MSIYSANRINYSQLDMTPDTSVAEMCLEEMSFLVEAAGHSIFETLIERDFQEVLDIKLNEDGENADSSSSSSDSSSSSNTSSNDNSSSNNNSNDNNSSSNTSSNDNNSNSSSNDNNSSSDNKDKSPEEKNKDEEVKKTLGEKIKDFFKNLVERLKGLFESISTKFLQVIGNDKKLIENNRKYLIIENLKGFEGVPECFNLKEFNSQVEDLRNYIDSDFLQSKINDASKLDDINGKIPKIEEITDKIDTVSSKTDTWKPSSDNDIKEVINMIEDFDLDKTLKTNKEILKNCEYWSNNNSMSGTNTAEQAKSLAEATIKYAKALIKALNKINNCEKAKYKQLRKCLVTMINYAKTHKDSGDEDTEEEENNEENNNEENNEENGEENKSEEENNEGNNNEENKTEENKNSENTENNNNSGEKSWENMTPSEKKSEDFDRWAKEEKERQNNIGAKNKEAVKAAKEKYKAEKAAQKQANNSNNNTETNNSNEPKPAENNKAKNRAERRAANSAKRRANRKAKKNARKAKQEAYNFLLAERSNMYVDQALDIIEGTYFESGLLAALDADIAFNRLFKTVGLHELKEFVEVDSLALYEGARFDSIKEAIINFFKGLLERIKKLFRTIAEKFTDQQKKYFESVLPKDKLKKITNADIRELDNERVVKSIGTIYVYELEGIDRYFDSLASYAEKVSTRANKYFKDGNKDVVSTIKRDIEDIKSNYIKKCTGFNATTSTELKKAIIDKHQKKQDVDKAWLLKNWKNVVHNLQGKNTASMMKESYESVNKCLNNCIKDIDKWDGDASTTDLAKEAAAAIKSIVKTTIDVSTVLLDLMNKEFKVNAMIAFKVVNLTGRLKELEDNNAKDNAIKMTVER